MKISSRVMYMFAAINVILAIFVWFKIPETKGVQLEDMDTIFGGVSHVAKGAQLVHDEHGEVIHGKTAADGIGITTEEIELGKGHRRASHVENA